MMAEVLFLSDRAAHEVRGSKTVGATGASVFAGTVWKKFCQHKLSGLFSKTQTTTLAALRVWAFQLVGFPTPQRNWVGLGGTISTEVQEFT